jgi:drug/metabolite transporter (DMT)-like permease
MPAASLVHMIVLAALWGASYPLLRHGVPSFGAAWIIELRVGIAFVFLLMVGVLLGRRFEWRTRWRNYLLMGLFNSAAPFFLFAYALKTLPASLVSVFNSTAPIWGALLGAMFLRVPISRSAGVGLGLGLCGVAVLAVGSMPTMPEGNALPMLAAALAPLCYAIASALAKRTRAPGSAFEDATGSMAASSILGLLLCLVLPMPGTPTGTAWASALALGVLCTGIAYLLYFRLTADVGPMKALAVTFLIPVFGTLWGVVLLGEAVTRELLGGGALILAGTALTTGMGRVARR